MAIPKFEWRGERPADADAWERLVLDDVRDPIGGMSIVIERVANGWRVLTARSGGTAIGQGTTFPVPLPIVDERDRITRLLREAGRPVID